MMPTSFPNFSSQCSCDLKKGKMPTLNCHFGRGQDGFHVKGKAMKSFDIENSAFPENLVGRRFYCGHQMDALLERVPNGDEVAVSAYSLGIVGMLARAYSQILEGKTQGTIPWGNGKLEWVIE